MSLEKFGVRVENPEVVIEIEGQSYAELLLDMYLRVENLKRVGQVLALEEGTHGNVRMAAMRRSIDAMVNASEGILQECLRVAREQGLQFAFVSERPAAH